MRLQPPPVPTPARRRAVGAPPAHPSRISRLIVAYGACGGLLRSDDLISRLQDRGGQPVSKLARWIVGREVLSLEHDGQFWLPSFQFHPQVMDIRPCARQVIAELRPAFDARELLDWFVAPNAWLSGCRPASALDEDPDEVFQAARADRFVALGN